MLVQHDFSESACNQLWKDRHSSHQLANGKRLDTLGRSLCAETATTENPAPAVVLTHGSWKSREVMSTYTMELSRRGYVVFAFDQYGHGESGNTPATGYDMYGTFVSTGIPFWSKTSFERQLGCWLYGIVIILIVAPFTARKIYKKTNNPYLGGIINALIVTMMTVTFTNQFH